MFGWMFFGIGMVFVWAFLPLADFSFVLFSGEMQLTPGELVSSRSANVVINDEQLYVYDYRYVVAGDTLEGVSYSSRDSPNPNWGNIEIEYQVDQPYVSRIKGMNNQEMPFFILIIAIFPLIGLVFILIGYAKGLKAVGLLKVGKPAFGELIKKEPTNTKVNGRTVYRYFFEFADEHGNKHTMVTKTPNYSLLEDDELEELLYDPRRPSFAVTLDDLPGRPVCSHGGVVNFSRAGEGTWMMIPALVSILVHGGIALYFLFF